MLRRTALAAASLLAASALLLSACTGDSTPTPSATGAPDPDASAVIRLVLEPGNLDIRETAGRYNILHRGAQRVQTVTCNVGNLAAGVVSHQCLPP